MESNPEYASNNSGPPCLHQNNGPRVNYFTIHRHLQPLLLHPPECRGSSPVPINSWLPYVMHLPGPYSSWQEPTWIPSSSIDNRSTSICVAPLLRCTLCTANSQANYRACSQANYTDISQANYRACSQANYTDISQANFRVNSQPNSGANSQPDFLANSQANFQANLAPMKAFGMPSNCKQAYNLLLCYLDDMWPKISQDSSSGQPRLPSEEYQQEDANNSAELSNYSIIQSRRSPSFDSDISIITDLSESFTTEILSDIELHAAAEDIAEALAPDWESKMEIQRPDSSSSDSSSEHQRCRKRRRLNPEIHGEPSTNYGQISHYPQLNQFPLPPQTSQLHQPFLHCHPSLPAQSSEPPQPCPSPEPSQPHSTTQTANKSPLWKGKGRGKRSTR